MNYTIESMREAVEAGTAKILTTSMAEKLKGKKISTIYFGYRGQDGFDEFVVGEVVSEIDYYRNLKEDCYLNDPKFKNRAEYWESYMTEKQLSEKRNSFILITADGRCTSCKAHQENDGAFTCSDIDRFVYFVQHEN